MSTRIGAVRQEMRPSQKAKREGRLIMGLRKYSEHFCQNHWSDKKRSSFADLAHNDDSARPRKKDIWESNAL